MATQSQERSTVLPPDDLEGMLDLSKFLDSVSTPAALLGPDGQTVALPLEAFRVLREVAHAMRVGKAITVAPVDQLLTTQEAANFLGISRPTLVKLLESREIPFQSPGAGRHRRVRLQDVIDYQDRKRSRRRELLDEMTEAAAQAGLYESDADYTEALKAARRQRG
jgi:excisionase family DNA binding protein